jgi:hypothetical protein
MKYGEDNIKMYLREIECGDIDSFIWLNIRTSGGLCKHGNELPVFKIEKSVTIKENVR